MLERNINFVCCDEVSNQNFTSILDQEQTVTALN